MATATKTVGDIVVENPAAVRVFEKYGIDYCCGGKVSLEDACAAKQVSVGEVSAALDAEPAAPAKDSVDWSKEKLAKLTNHIVEVHHWYVTRETPRLNGLATKVVSRHGDTHQELAEIQAKMAELGDEMIEHQGKEEIVLFPYIGKLERFASGDGAAPRNAFGSVAQPIAMMTKDHDLAGNLMADIRRLSHEYTPPADACATYCAFYEGLRDFERDLHLHLHLENNILFPKAMALEASL